MTGNLSDPLAKTAIFTAIALALITPTVTCYDMMSPTRVRLAKTHMHIRGGGGITIPYHEIDTVQLIRWQEIPSPVSRKRGGSSTNFKKGLFASVTGEELYLYLHKPKEAKYIILIKRDQKPDIYYTSNKAQAYEQLTMSIERAASE